MSEDPIQKVLEAVDDYEQAVNVSLSFVHIYLWDKSSNALLAGSSFGLGWLYQPGNVTPDITIRLPSNAGIVAELKISLPKNDDSAVGDKWEDKFDQLRKYDVQLRGWDGKDAVVAQQELVLLVDQKLVRRVIDYMSSKGTHYNQHSKNFAVIQYSPATGVKDGLFMRLEHGAMDDHNGVTMSRLRDGIAVSFEYLFSSGLSRIELLDYKPPVVYLMTLLWDKVFNVLVTPEQWDEARLRGGKRILPVVVTPSQLRDFLVKNFADKSSCQSFKQKWVEEALDCFVKLKLAEKVEKTDRYLIKYRKTINTDVKDGNKHRVFAQALYSPGSQARLEKFT